MYRQEFIDGVTSWSELVDFCNDEGLDHCDDIYSDEQKDDWVNEHLDDICEDATWQDVLCTLRSVPEGYDYYLKDEDYWMEFRGLSNDEDLFYHRKEEILEYMDEHGRWEEDDEDEIDEDDVFESPFDDDESDEFEVDTSVSLDDFFASSADDLDKITSEAKATEAKANADFNKFTQRVTTVGDY